MKLFKPQNAEDFNRDLLEEAQREIVKHLAAVEYSQAMIKLYQERITRLEPSHAKS